MEPYIEKNKHIYYDFCRSLLTIDQENLTEHISTYCHPEISWYGPDPFDEQIGLEAHIKDFWIPFITAFPNIEKNPYVMLSGTDEDGQQWVSATGYYRATFEQDWLGIPHTGRPMFIRFGEWCRIKDDKIIEVYTILDIMDVMRIAGIDLGFPVWGSQELALGPATQDGLWITSQDTDAAGKAAKMFDDLIDGMMDFDGIEMDSMHQWDYWDADHMIWAGPAGIGQTRGLTGYQNYHQGPWLKAFPDRYSHGELHHMPLLAQGDFCCAGVWSDGENIFGTHTGGDLLGLAATGKTFKLRDYDWYRLEDGKIVENWCFIDNIHLMRQLGIDVFDRMKKSLSTDRINR